MFGPVQSQWITSQAKPLTEGGSILQCMVVIVSAVSSAPKASWVVMYTMNNHTYNAMRVWQPTWGVIFILFQA